MHEQQIYAQSQQAILMAQASAPQLQVPANTNAQKMQRSMHQPQNTGAAENQAASAASAEAQGANQAAARQEQANRTARVTAVGQAQDTAPSGGAAGPHQGQITKGMKEQTKKCTKRTKVPSAPKCLK